ncbi:hypothetical protein [Priestia filamentosa]|uniref:hypothetical protein n=1 Tax=Priestia filamentosa TaxID=1402861 RepID=UPI000E713FE7|nr:hypothetical protein [Priestia filamentosa]RJS65215.1 hypothetical protein CJ485_10755 [Priestia filamentosa]WCM16584.1 hypothetical protein PGN40_04335 [Priestia filamentosa]
MISSHPYIHITKKIKHNRQEYEELEYQLELYEDKIVAGAEQFAIKAVLDISYRITTKSYGFLYLHTTKGVFSYLVKENPQLFIRHCKEKLNW